MQHLLVIFLLFFSIPSFSEKATCSNAFSEKDQKSLDFVNEIRFQKPLLRIPTSLAIATGGATAIGHAFVNQSVPMAILGSFLLAEGFRMYHHPKPQEQKFIAFKQGLISKYGEETIDTFSRREENFIYRAIPFINHGISKRASKKLLQFLIDKGENINEGVGDAKNTPMHLAAKMNNPLAIKLLHELGGDLHAKNAEGLSPRHVALDHNAKRAEEALNKLLAEEAFREAYRESEVSAEDVAHYAEKLK